MHQDTFTVSTRGRGAVELTDTVQRIVAGSGAATGVCHVFLQHTSASLMLCENADPTVRRDLEAFLARLAPDGDRAYAHRSEGPDDMPSHIGSVLVGASLTIPVTSARLALGTWQGIYLWEHRARPHERRVTVTVLY
jgi:secondary thiamine-phosphate synthase enzyme